MTHERIPLGQGRRQRRQERAEEIPDNPGGGTSVKEPQPRHEKNQAQRRTPVIEKITPEPAPGPSQPAKKIRAAG